MVSQGRCLTLPFTLVRESADCPSLRASSQSPTSFSKGGLVDPRMRASNGGHPILNPLFGGVAKAALYCAHRTSTVLSCAFCEQEGHLAAPTPSFQARSFLSPSGWPGLALNCARRARPFRGRALREQRGPTRLPTISTPPRSSLLQIPPSSRRSLPVPFPNTPLFESVYTDGEGRDG